VVTAPDLPSLLYARRAGLPGFKLNPKDELLVKNTRANGSAQMASQEWRDADGSAARPAKGKGSLGSSRLGWADMPSGKGQVQRGMGTHLAGPEGVPLGVAACVFARVGPQCA